MEGRLPASLQLEMTDLAAQAYAQRRAAAWRGRRVTMFSNERRGRDDLPRTIAEFDTLAVVECDDDAAIAPADDSLVASYRFVRTPRPGQGSLTDEPTTGLQLVLISPKDDTQAQALRDWADFVHLRHIAEAAVPGFRMITPYVNADPDRGGPRFLHFYEMHTSDPESAFQAMTPLVAARLGGDDTDEFRDWAWHPQLQIDYVNTFRRVG